MLMPQRRLNIINRRIRQTTPVKDVQPFLRRLRSRHLLDHTAQRDAILHAGRIGDEARVGGPGGMAQFGAHDGEEPVVATAEEDVAVGGGEGLVGDY